MRAISPMTQIRKRVIPPLRNLVKDINVWEFPQLNSWVKFFTRHLTLDCGSAWHRPICVTTYLKDLLTQLMEEESLTKSSRPWPLAGVYAVGENKGLT